MFNSLEFRCLISSAKVDNKGMRIYSGTLSTDSDGDQKKKKKNKYVQV